MPWSPFVVKSVYTSPCCCRCSVCVSVYISQPIPNAFSFVSSNGPVRNRIRQRSTNATTTTVTVAARCYSCVLKCFRFEVCQRHSFRTDVFFLSFFSSTWNWALICWSFHVTFRLFEIHVNVFLHQKINFYIVQRLVSQSIQVVGNRGV